MGDLKSRQRRLSFGHLGSVYGFWFNLWTVVKEGRCLLGKVCYKVAVRTFHIHFAVASDSETGAGAWGFALVEDREIIFNKDRFEIEKTSVEALELSAILNAISNLETVKSDFRILICYDKAQLNGFGLEHSQKKKEIISGLKNRGLDVRSKKYTVDLNQVKTPDVWLNLQRETQATLKKEMSLNYW
jgi:ribonuclease HI